MARKPSNTEPSLRDVLSADFVTRLQAKWQEHGDDILEHMRQKDPVKFAEMVAKLVPPETLPADPFAGGLSMDEIGKRLLLQVGANEFAITPDMIEAALKANDALIAELCRIAGRAIQ